ncbi:MAG: N-acetylmuramoyl-L-alanine amidase [Lachnospiraceae bacterium]|nr:N-acetylmuramoyl-L-alanine amidase [Lachnospiraceae bacterium]
MKILEKISNKLNYKKSSKKRNIEFLVEHYSAGTKDTTQNELDYFARENVGVSAHDFVDDFSVGHSVPYNDVAYHCGVDYSNGKAPYWGKCTNYNSIGIEMCALKDDKILDLRNPTINNAIILTKQLMKEYNIDADHVVRHYDVCGKNCPAPLVEDAAAWKCFKYNLQTPFKVKTTKEGVKAYSKIGGAVVDKFELGKKITITEVYLQNEHLYAKSKKGIFFRLKYTKKLVTR